MQRVERYRTIVLEFHTKKMYENPIRDCVIKAEFVGPESQRIIREAFWDGNDTYKISFAPISIGTWKYHLECMEPELNNVQGEIECIPSDGGLEIYRHGFIGISRDKRYFTYADEKPFFWLGDTHWEFAYGEKWDESNHSNMKSMFKGMVKQRMNQGYTVYQTNLRSDAMMGGDKLYWTEDGLPNIRFYQEELDRRMYYIAEHGFVNALGFAWFMSIENNVEKYKDFVRYFIARYGSLPIVWTLAGEVGGYDKTKRQIYLDGWKEIALLIRKLDSYHHLMTAHYTNERPFASYYQDEEWLDFTLNQAGHGDYVICADDYKYFLNKYGDKPFVEGEAMYEFCSTLEENGTRICTDSMLRRVAYLAIQSGGCGYTYGAQGIWDNVWEKRQENPMRLFNRYDITWYEAIDGVGGCQMGYMKKFYEEQEFWKLYPYESTGDATGNPFGKKMPLITVSEDKTHWVFYYPEASRKSGEVKGFHNAIYQMLWFNPRTGEYCSKSEEVQIKNNTWKIPMKPDENDWCMVMKEK